MYGPGVRIFLPGKACLLLRVVERRLGPSAVKSASAWLLMLSVCSNLIPKPWSSMAHAEMRPVASGVVSWIADTGSKGYPIFRFGMGREQGWEMSSAGRTSSRPSIYVLASNAGTQGDYPGSGRPEAKSPTPACLD